MYPTNLDVCSIPNYNAYNEICDKSWWSKEQTSGTSQNLDCTSRISRLRHILRRFTILWSINMGFSIREFKMFCTTRVVLKKGGEMNVSFGYDCQDKNLSKDKNPSKRDLRAMDTPKLSVWNSRRVTRLAHKRCVAKGSKTKGPPIQQLHPGFTEGRWSFKWSSDSRGDTAAQR